MEKGVEVIAVDYLEEVLNGVLEPPRVTETIEINLAENPASLHKVLKGIKLPATNLPQPGKPC